MPKSRVRKNRKQPFYFQTIVEKPTLVKDDEVIPNPRYPRKFQIKHRLIN